MQYFVSPRRLQGILEMEVQNAEHIVVQQPARIANPSSIAATRKVDPKLQATFGLEERRGAAFAVKPCGVRSVMRVQRGKRYDLLK